MIWWYQWIPRDIQMIPRMHLNAVSAAISTASDGFLFFVVKYAQVWRLQDAMI